jgi:hypothetical protein
VVFLPARPHKVNKSEHALGTTLLLINPVRVPGRAAGALAAACVPTTQCRTVLTVTDDTPAARGLVVSRRSSLLLSERRAAWEVVSAASTIFRPGSTAPVLPSRFAREQLLLLQVRRRKEGIPVAESKHSWGISAEELQPTQRLKGKAQEARRKALKLGPVGAGRSFAKPGPRLPVGRPIRARLA